MISEDDKEFLEKNRHHWDLWQRAQIFNQLDSGVRERLLRITQKHFCSTYLANLWCGPCVVDLLKFTYTQYDKWLKENPTNVAG